MSDSGDEFDFGYNSDSGHDSDFGTGPGLENSGAVGLSQDKDSDKED